MLANYLHNLKCQLISKGFFEKRKKQIPDKKYPRNSKQIIYDLLKIRNSFFMKACDESHIN